MDENTPFTPPLVVLTGSTTSLRVRQRTDEIATTVATAIPGSYAEVEIPFDSKPGPA